jgi:ArsR family transcriptional regulator, arsenate/arsenite/antimonite-responsive transcriptional repressor
MPHVAAKGTAKDVSRLVTIFHALSDETRLRLIACLKDGEQCVCDLTEAFQTGQSRLSFHLKVLKEAGLIKDRPEGRWIYYALNDETLEELQDVMDWISKPAPRSARRDCCD